MGRPLNERDRWLVSQIGPTLAARGMIFVGLDVIGGYVTEINVTSPTGIRELDKQFNLNIADLLMQAIEKREAESGSIVSVVHDAAGRQLTRLAETRTAILISWPRRAPSPAKASHPSRSACSPRCSWRGSCTPS